MGLVSRERCPACASADRRTVLQRSYADPKLVEFAHHHYPSIPPGRFEAATRGATYELAACLGCGLTYQVNVPDDELLHELYDVWCDAGTSEAKHRRKLDGGRSAKLLQDALVMVGLHGKKPTSLRALDYGAGWGAWCAAARALGIATSAYELGSDRREGLRAQGVDIATDGDLGQGTFDLINTEQVFEHLIDPLAVIDVLARSLTPGGILRIAVPSGEHLWPRLRREHWMASRSSFWSLMPVIPLEHVNAFTGASLRQLGARVGLEPVSAGVRADYANLVATGSLAKALLRPVYFRLIGRNLTVHFRRAS
jgi:SAM-dependent methyltransferase